MKRSEWSSSEKADKAPRHSSPKPPQLLRCVLRVLTTLWDHRKDQQSRVLYELSALIFNLLRNPPTPIQLSGEVSPSSGRQTHRLPLTQITPAGFASLLLGISLSLMLCGSITFFIGFLLMPWVLGLVMVFYVIGIVSSLAMLGRAIFHHALSPKKSVPAWKLL